MTDVLAAAPAEPNAAPLRDILRERIFVLSSLNGDGTESHEWTGDGLSFCEANEFPLFTIAAMFVGGADMMFGGGAAPIFILRRTK